MNFDDFLTAHQKIMNNPRLEDMKQFILNVNICIEAYVEALKGYQRESKRLEGILKHILILRDEMMVLKENYGTGKT